MSTELNSGTVGGFGHMGPNDPYNDGHSGSGSSGGSFNGGGNGGHDNSSGSSYTASFGLITGRHPITVPGTKNINSVDLSAVINNIIGVSLDIENYCTLRLLFNQSLVLDKVPEYGKPAKCCSP